MIIGGGDNDNEDEDERLLLEYVCPLLAPRPWDFSPFFLPMGTYVTLTQ